MRTNGASFDRRAMTPEEARAVAESWRSEVGMRVLFVALSWNAARGKVDKRPAGTMHGYEDASDDPAAIDAMLRRAVDDLREGEVLGCAGVPASAGLTFGDFDTKNGAAGAATLRAMLDEFPDAMICRYHSVSRALNLIWRRPAGCPPLRNAAPGGWHGFELRDAHGYIVLPGTFTPWGAWHFDEGSVEPAEAWEMPDDLVLRFKAANDAARNATSPEIASYIASRRGYRGNGRGVVEDILGEFQTHAANGRHPALVRALGRLVGLTFIDLGDALAQLQTSWDAVTIGEGREREPMEALAWVVGQQREHDARVRVEWPEAAGDDGDDEIDAEATLRSIEPLPAAFWEADVLARVHRCAKQRMVTPEALLADLFVEILGYTSPAVVLPDLIGTFVSLNLDVAKIAPSGLGKSSAAGAARGALRVLGAPTVTPQHLVLGTGEGAIEAFLGMVPDDDGKLHKVQIRQSIILTADEGAALNVIAERRDATLLAVLRAAWMGAELGAANASRETFRYLAAHAYRLGFVVNFTPAVAAETIRGVEYGTPQRVLWTSAQDFAMERREGKVPPSVIEWTPPPTPPKGKRQEILLPPAVRVEIEDEHIRRQRGGAFDPLDSHRNLMREKVCAALALLDDTRRQRYRALVTDWQRAGAFIDYSDRVRDAERAMLRERYRRSERARRHSLARDRVAETAAVDRYTADACACRVAEIVWSDGGEWTARRLRQRVPRYRAVFEDGLDAAKRHGWIVERVGGGQGEGKRRITRGEKRP